MREILVCLNCNKYIFVNSPANKAPRWTGKVGDVPEKRKEIGAQDDLRVFKKKHYKHEIIEADVDFYD